MEKVLCAFSSNSRPLYIGDIYKVLSMPKGFIAHFRYKRKYVDQSVINESQKYLNKYVHIFFTDIVNDKVTNYSVRKARVTKIQFESTTDLVHIYMSLESFVTTQLSNKISNDSLPQNKYLVPLEIESQNTASWQEKIELLNPFFKDFSFFHLKNLTKANGEEIKLSKRSDNKRAFYDLTQGSDYLLNISLSNPQNTSSSINISSSSDDLSLNRENPISITARYDDQVVPLHLKSLNVSLENSFITFGPILSSDSDSKHVKEYQASIEIQKKLGVWNAIKFGIASLLAVLAIWTIKDHSESIWNVNKSNSFDFVLIFACLILLGSTSYLYHKFNKK